MLHIKQTDLFAMWLRRLRDRQARNQILKRLDAAQKGHPGDYKYPGTNLYEMRIYTGKGYRLYFTHQGSTLILLLCGGHKGTQSRDIAKARRMLVSNSIFEKTRNHENH